MEKSFFSSSQEVKLGKILKFIIPTYLTSLFNTLYTIVDGVFVSAYVGTNALAAINIVYPIVNILTGIALLFATGGSAIAALHIGAHKEKEANRVFSASVVASIVLGCLISGGVLLNLSTILRMMGATSVTMEACRIYILLWLIGTPVVVGKEVFTYFIRVDGSPGYSFFLALSGGVLNIILDYLFIRHMNLGIFGAALATVLGLVLSFLLGIYYFLRRKKILHFCFSGFSPFLAFQCLGNGASEFVNQTAVAVTTIVFNRTAMIFAGEDGIAAVSIIMYLQYIFIGIYFGYSMGIAPPLGYAFGEQKFQICKILEKYSCRFLTVASLMIYAATFFLAPLGVGFFAEPESEVYYIAVSGMRIYGLGFLPAGLNIFSAIRMMAYGKGYFSGCITFLRSFALLLLFLEVFPKFFGLNGIWLAVPAAEALTSVVALAFLLGQPKEMNGYRKFIKKRYKESIAE